MVKIVKTQGVNVDVDTADVDLAVEHALGKKPGKYTGMTDEDIVEMARGNKSKKEERPKDPTRWTNGVFDCCSLKPKQGCPCCVTNICCGPCAFGNAMELAELGDIWPGWCRTVCVGRCCPSHLIGDQCLPTCTLALDCHLNCLYSLWAGKRIADKYGITFDLKKEVVEAVLCPPCYRWKVTHEIMEREDLVYFSECGLCEIIKNEPEDDEKEEGGEEEDAKGKEDEKRDVEPAAASAGAPTVSEMVR